MESDIDGVCNNSIVFIVVIGVEVSKNGGICRYGWQELVIEVGRIVIGQFGDVFFVVVVFVVVICKGVEVGKVDFLLQGNVINVIIIWICQFIIFR